MSFPTGASVFYTGVPVYISTPFSVSHCFPPVFPLISFPRTFHPPLLSRFNCFLFFSPMLFPPQVFFLQLVSSCFTQYFLRGYLMFTSISPLIFHFLVGFFFFFTISPFFFQVSLLSMCFPIFSRDASLVIPMFSSLMFIPGIFVCVF